MSTTEFLQKIEPFSLSERAPSNWEKYLATSNHETLHKPKIFNTPIELVESIIENDGNCSGLGAFEDFLNKSSVYKCWQKFMPTMKDVKNLKHYRNDRLSTDSNEAVNKEILKFGRFLPIEQILYRGCISTDQIFLSPTSTSLSPGVAFAHARRKNGKILIIELGSDNINGFVFSSSRTNRHWAEYEILLERGLRKIVKEKKTISSFEVEVIELKRADA